MPRKYSALLALALAVTSALALASVLDGCARKRSPSQAAAAAASGRAPEATTAAAGPGGGQVKSPAPPPLPPALGDQSAAPGNPSAAPGVTSAAPGSPSAAPGVPSDTGPKVPVPPPPPGGPANSAQIRQLSQHPQTQQLPRPATVPVPPQPPMAASIRAFGLGVESTPRMPRDFSLGPLQSSRPDSADEVAVFKAASSFLGSLAEGKLDTSQLLPEARDALSALLAPRPKASGETPAAPDQGQADAGAAPKGQPPATGSEPPAATSSGPPSPRLGAIGIQGDDASLRVRLPASPGAPRQEGLLSLRKVSDAWYVEALSLDPPSSGALVFSPDSSAQTR